MIEREPQREAEELESELEELARRNTKLHELAFTHLHFLRKRVRVWLKVLQFPLAEVLTENEEKMVRFYSGLGQGERMCSLKDTAAFIGKSPKAERSVAVHLRYAWLRVKGRELLGPEAVETLKLPRFLYMSLVRNEVTRIGEISEFTEAEIIKVCGTETGLTVLKEAMRAKGFDFDPQVTFPLFTHGAQ